MAVRGPGRWTHMPDIHWPPLLSERLPGGAITPEFYLLPGESRSPLQATQDQEGMTVSRTHGQKYTTKIFPASTIHDLAQKRRCPTSCCSV